MYSRYDYRIDSKLIDYYKWVESRERRTMRMDKKELEGRRVNRQQIKDADNKKLVKEAREG